MKGGSPHGQSGVKGKNCDCSTWCEVSRDMSSDVLAINQCELNEMRADLKIGMEISYFCCLSGPITCAKST